MLVIGPYFVWVTVSRHFGRVGWVGVYGVLFWLGGALFWEGGDERENILGGWRWVEMNGSEWVWVHCLIMPIHFQSLKYTAVIRICKNLSNFPFLSKWNKAGITVFWWKQPTSNSFQTCLYCMYSLKLYNKSIIILLTNDLANICSEISKIRSIYEWFILAMWKGWKKLKSWVKIYFASLTKITSDERL